MPELPDVESFRRYLARTALHQRIQRVAVHSRKIVCQVTPQRFADRLTGRRLIAARRHGKWLLAHLDDRGALALHFGMTAYLRYRRSGDGREAREARHRHDRITVRFTNGAWLAFNDQRLFGRMTVVEDPAGFVADQRLGPDALTVSWKEFRAIVARRRGSVKAFLMDQSALAGIGNLYADEILFQACIHPLARAASLSDRTVRAMYSSMRGVLRTAIRLNAESRRFPAAWLFRHREKDGRCPRCSGALKRLMAGGRTAVFCPRCQHGR